MSAIERRWWLFFSCPWGGRWVLGHQLAATGSVLSGRLLMSDTAALMEVRTHVPGQRGAKDGVTENRLSRRPRPQLRTEGSTPGGVDTRPALVAGERKTGCRAASSVPWYRQGAPCPATGEWLVL